MFRKIRQRDLKKVLWVLVIVIGLAFVLFGTRGLVREKGYSAILYGKKLSLKEFQSFVRNLQVYLLLSFGREFVQEIKPENLMNSAWQDILLVTKAARENIKVTDSEVAKKIKNFPLLNTGRGFSKERYLNILKRFGISAGRFEDFLRSYLKAEKLKDKIVKGITVSDKELMKQYRIEHEEAKIQYLFIGFDKLKNAITPENAQLQDFFTKNSQNFREPAKVKIAYLRIKSAGDEIRNKLQREVAKKTPLKSIAKKFNLKIIHSDFFSINEPIRDLGWQKELTELAFEIGRGEVAGPVETSEGLIILEKTDEQSARIPEFSEVASKVEEEFKTAQARTEAELQAKEIIARIQQENIKDLKQLQKSAAIELKETDFFKRNDFVENIGLKPEFNSKIFELKVKEILLEPVELKKGFYIVQLIDFKPVNEKKFIEEKDEFGKKVLQVKKIMTLNGYIVKLAEESKLTILQQ